MGRRERMEAYDRLQGRVRDQIASAQRGQQQARDESNRFLAGLGIVLIVAALVSVALAVWP